MRIRSIFWMAVFAGLPALAQESIQQIGLLGPQTFLGANAPIAALADPERDLLYVLSEDVNTPLTAYPGVLSFLTKDGTFLDNMALRPGPVGLTQSATTGLLFIANGKDKSLSILDPDTRQILRTEPMPGEAQPLAIDQDVVLGEQFIYVLASTRVHIWDEAKARWHGQLPTHNQPGKMRINRTSNTIYVLDASLNGSTVDIMRNNSSFISSEVGITQVDIAIDELHSKAYVLAKKDIFAPRQWVVRLDEASGGAPIQEMLPAGFSNASGVVVDPEGERVFVAAQGLEGALVLTSTLDLVYGAATALPSPWKNDSFRSGPAWWDPIHGRVWVGLTSSQSGVGGFGAYDPGREQVLVRSLQTTSMTPDLMVPAPGGQWLYLVHKRDDSVTVIDTVSAGARNTVIGVFPRKLVLDVERGRAYAVSAQSRLGEGGSGVVIGIELATREVTLIDIGATSVDLALDPLTGNVFTGGSFLGEDTSQPDQPPRPRTYSAIIGIRPDGSTFHSLSESSRPLAVAVDPGDRVYLLSTAESGSDAIALFSVGGEVLCAERQLGPQLKSLAISPQLNAAFVGNFENKSLIRFVQETCSDQVLPLQVAAGTEPGKILIDDASDRVYVANRGDGTLSVYSLSNLTSQQGNHLAIATIGLAPSGRPKTHPVSMALDPDTKRLYVANEQQTYVSVVDTESLTLAGVIDGTAAGTQKTVDLIVERTVQPHRLQLIYNEFEDVFQTRTKGWLTTVTLDASPTVARRQVGERLAHLVVDPVREEVIVADLGTSSLFILPARPPVLPAPPAGALAAWLLGSAAVLALRRRRL
jgi:DNA-binding beta-propeller fold protein YncE